MPHWDEKRYTGEIRPILGYRGEGWSLTVNPILDNSYVGFSRLDFAPATRLDFEVAKDWTIAAEEYDDFGELRGFMPARDQSHQLFAVVDHDMGTGVGGIRRRLRPDAGHRQAHLQADPLQRPQRRQRHLWPVNLAPNPFFICHARESGKVDSRSKCNSWLRKTSAGRVRSQGIFWACYCRR